MASHLYNYTPNPCGVAGRLVQEKNASNVIYKCKCIDGYYGAYCQYGQCFNANMLNMIDYLKKC